MVESFGSDSFEFSFSFFFKGRTVAIKRLNKKTVHMTREILIQLKQVSKYISL